MSKSFFCSIPRSPCRASTGCIKIETEPTEARVAEIARILGGIDITDAQRTAAREMLDEGEKY